jgi:hypothetical protein
MRARALSLISLALAGSLGATTLEQLTLDDMAQKSTAIVRARVTGSHTAYVATSSGKDIYTYFQLQVLETWKSGPAMAEVAIPGGVVDGIRQRVGGAPELLPGREYVLFLWTSRSGLTQLIGLSQGVFTLSSDAPGNEPGKEMVQRPAASELMLDRSGLPVEDRAVSMRLPELKARVIKATGAAK